MTRSAQTILRTTRRTRSTRPRPSWTKFWPRTTHRRTTATDQSRRKTGARLRTSSCLSRLTASWRMPRRRGTRSTRFCKRPGKTMRRMRRALNLRRSLMISKRGHCLNQLQKTSTQSRSLTSRQWPCSESCSLGWERKSRSRRRVNPLMTKTRMTKMMKMMTKKEKTMRLMKR